MALNQDARLAARRRVLGLAGWVMLSGLAGQQLLFRQARAGIAAGSTLADFVATSQALTGRAALDPGLAAGFYKAFQLAVAGFDVTLPALRATLARDGAALQGDKLAFTDQQKAQHALSQAILQAWYLGVVGKGNKAVCVTYVEALANRVVADTLEPPSFSYGPCGSWSSRP